MEIYQMLVSGDGRMVLRVMSPRRHGGRLPSLTRVLQLWWEARRDSGRSRVTGVSASSVTMKMGFNPGVVFRLVSI